VLTATAPLTASDEATLIPLAKAGEKAAQAAILSSQVRWLRAEARKYAGASSVDPDDLVAAGLEALLGALATFDPARGVRFWTHAQNPVRLAMAEEVAAYGTQIAVPGRTLRRYRKAVRETGSIAEARALARTRDGMDEGTFDAVHHALTGGTSLDASFDAAPAADTAAGTAGALDSETGLLGSRGPSPEGTAVSRAMTRQALASLDARQRQVVALAYLTGEDLSDAQIAARLGLSRPTVTRARNAALGVMRDALA
jgi:RNA polymerase sigma factor for flagellar operon FliA